MMTTPDILCIGQAVLDCITRGQEPDPHKKNVFRAEEIRLSTGGDAINESFVLATRGRNVSVVCGVGTDLAGNILLSEMQSRGIDTSRVTVSEALHTPIANLIVRADGSRFSINSPATKLSGYIPSAEDILTSGAKIISFASLFRAPLDDPETIKELIRAAHESGAIVCADTKLPTFRAVTLDEIAEVLPLIDFIFPNENEASYLTGVPLPVRAPGVGSPTTSEEVNSGENEVFRQIASVFHAYGIRRVIIKAGALGCFASEAHIPRNLRSAALSPSGKESHAVSARAQLSGSTFLHLPAKNVPVIDTTGAGDNFVAGFLDALLSSGISAEALRQESSFPAFKACLDTGLESASLSIQHIGAVSNEP